jgi:hypothetical protein
MQHAGMAQKEGGPAALSTHLVVWAHLERELGASSSRLGTRSCQHQSGQTEKQHGGQFLLAKTEIFDDDF